MTDSSSSHTPPPRFQFGVRDLLLLTLGCGDLGLFWASFHAPDAKDVSIGFAAAMVLALVLGLASIKLWFKDEARYKALIYFGFLYGGFCLCTATLLPSLLPSRMVMNERHAERFCWQFCHAQEAYFMRDRKGVGVREYAQSLMDLWETRPNGADLRLIEWECARAESALKDGKPHLGYYFKILRSECGGRSAAVKNYVVNGRMTQGYALLAYPSQYDGTGRNTYIVSDAKTIYFKDLGTATDSIVDRTTAYCVDSTWLIE